MNDTAAAQPKVTQTLVSTDTQTDAGEPILYLSTPNPEVSSYIFEFEPGASTKWMVHPAPGYVYVLEGSFTVEFDDGRVLEFRAGQGFLQARNAWHRGRNLTGQPVRFLAVFYGAAGVPNVLNPVVPA
jgi:quercetin dioxygenase-like cupin family protein